MKNTNAGHCLFQEDNFYTALFSKFPPEEHSRAQLIICMVFH